MPFLTSSEKNLTSQLANSFLTESDSGMLQEKLCEAIDAMYYSAIYHCFEMFQKFYGFLTENNHNSEENAFKCQYIDGLVWFDYFEVETSGILNKDKHIIFIKKNFSDDVLMLTFLDYFSCLKEPEPESYEELKVFRLFANFLNHETVVKYDNCFNDFRDFEKICPVTAKKLNYNVGLNDCRSDNYVFFIEEKNPEVKDAIYRTNEIKKALYLINTLNHSLFSE